MANAKIQTGLRLNEAVYSKLKTISEQEGRSLNNMVEFIIKRYLDEYEQVNGNIPVYPVQEL